MPSQPSRPAPGTLRPPSPGSTSTMRPAPVYHRPILLPSEAARLAGVNRKTLARWANAGRLPFHTTLGGHRRYRREDLLALLAAERPVQDGPQTRMSPRRPTPPVRSAQQAL